MSLTKSEMTHLRSSIKRAPTPTELDVVSAEWSEHCSYKSSKMHLGQLPNSSKLVISEKGYDSGVLDVGDGYVVTVHIESHNHPSAIEPYGGAATGVGGVIRDILSAGTRPIAILDGLRFGDVRKDAHAAWLFRKAVSGIAAYGNCLGIPTVGGEVEFDSSYSGYSLVDVAAVGFGKKELLIKNRAKSGDRVVLIILEDPLAVMGWAGHSLHQTGLNHPLCSTDTRSVHRENDHRSCTGSATGRSAS